jgi:alpha-glucosidase
MDQVWCHCSDRHAWFAQSRQSRDNARADWFVWAPPKADGTPPNNWLSYFGGPAWTWEASRGQYYFHQFLTSQPTFNLRHPGVRKALLDVGRFWLKLGVDGFRLDAVHTGFADPQLRNNPARPADMPVAPDVPSNIPQARQIRSRSEGHADTIPFLEDVRAMADRYNAVLLGEVSGENPYQRVALYTAGKRLHMAYNFGLLAAPPDAKSFKESVVQGEQGRHGEQGGHFAYALSNHDVRRVATRWSKGLNTGRVAKMALLFGMCLPGTYCMYQGEELGLPESDVPFDLMQDPFGLAFYPRFKGRDGCRTPFPWSRSASQGGFSKAKNTWLPFEDAHRALAVDVQERDHNSMLHFARRLIMWRKTASALKGGTFKPVSTKGNLIAFERANKQQRLLAVFNFGKTPLRFELPKGAWTRVHSVGAAIRGKALILSPMSGAVLTPVSKK